MCKRTLILVAAIFVAVFADAQGFPSSLPGSDTSNPLGQSNGSINCSDPLMAGSSACTGDLNSSSLRGGFGGGTGSTGVPYQQQGGVVTYTDDAGRPTSREKSTTIPLPPEPLTEFQK